MPQFVRFLVVLLASALLGGCGGGTEVTNPDERAFLKILDEGASAYEDAENELKEDKIEKERDQALCDPKWSNVKEWVGTVSQLSTGSGGLTLHVRVGSDYDLQQRSIKKDSPFAGLAAEVAEDEDVVFSGKFEMEKGCVIPSALFQGSRMEQPDFDFTFTDIKPAD